MPGLHHPLLALLALAGLLAAASGAPGSRRGLQQAPPPLAGAAPPGPAPEPNAGAGAASNDSCCQQLAAIGFASNLPVVVIDTMGQQLQWKHDQKDVHLCTCSGGAYQDYDGLAEAQVRGSTSANATKKSFDVALTKPSRKADGTTSKNKFPLLGMPSDASWVLYGGDEVDLTQGMRNFLAYNLARASGEYAPRTVWVEVFLRDDGAAALAPSHYHGIYIALEKLTVSPDRVDVAPLKPPNLSGGYLFSYENDNSEAGDVLFGPLVGWQFPFHMKQPKNATAAELSYLTDYLQAFQDALEAPDWLSRTPSYTTLIDGPSWLDYFLLTELTKNPDGYRGSIYLHKDVDRPVAAGPIWDLNEAFGLCCGYPIEGYNQNGASGPGQAGGSAISPEGWRFLICADLGRCLVDPTDGLSRWRMWQDPRFTVGAAARWAQLRAGPWSDAAINKLISDTTAQIKPAVLRNFQSYLTVLMKPWYATPEQEWTTEVANLQDWVTKHLAWMDDALAQAAAQPAAATSAPPPLTHRGGRAAALVKGM